MCSLSRTTDLIHRTDRRAKILTKEKIQAGIAQINSCYIWEKAGGIQNPLVYSMRTLSSSSSNWVRATWKRKSNTKFSLVQSLSRVQLLDPMDCSTLGLPVHLQLTEITQTLLHWVSDAIQTSYPLSPPSPDALNLSQNQGPFQWVRFSHQVASVLEFQLQYQSFQWSLRTDLLSVRGLSRVFSNTTVQRHQFFGTRLYSPILTFIHDYWKKHSLD